MYIETQILFSKMQTENLAKMQTENKPDIIDSEAPYGRKKNGEPYKTKPSLRKAIQKNHEKNKVKLLEYSRNYYANNTEKCRERIKNWEKEHPEKRREYFQKHYYDKKAELEYLRELFTQGLERI